MRASQPTQLPWRRTNQLIVAAAERLGVEATGLTREHTDFLLRLCWPAAPGGPRAVIVSKTRSPFLTQVAQTLANNKFVSRELLGARGLPIMRGELFDETADLRSDPAAAARARALLAQWGRVVVKPNWGNRGIGIVSDVREYDELLAAVEFAREHDHDEEVLIEPWIAGSNVRVAVIGGQVVAAAEVTRPYLEGDGRATIVELVARLNADARRGSWDRPSLVPMDVIEHELVQERMAVAGYDLEDVLAVGERIELCFEELEVIDRSDELHPGWAAVAAAAATALGIDVAGVDLRGPIELFTSRGPEHAHGAAGVLEVNALPALHLHALPTIGQPRPVFEAFVAYCLQMPGAPPPAAAILV
jgi:D-alanine-D-alanine ligase-like ATP-grasp enzyme